MSQREQGELPCPSLSKAHPIPGNTIRTDKVLMVEGVWAHKCLSWGSIKGPVPISSSRAQAKAPRLSPRSSRQGWDRAAQGRTGTSRQLWEQQALGMAQQCSKGALGQTSHWLDPARHQRGHKVTPGELVAVVGTVLAAWLLRLSIHLRLRGLCSPASTLCCVLQGSASVVLELGKAAGSAHSSHTTVEESELPTEEQGTETPALHSARGEPTHSTWVHPTCRKVRSPRPQLRLSHAPHPSPV